MSDNQDPRYPDNSYTRKERPGKSAEGGQPKPKSKAISGSAQIHTPLSRRIANSFKGDDSRTVGEYVLFDIIIPSLKEMVVDAGKDALERVFLGTSTPRSSRSRSGGSSYSYGGNRTPYGERYRGGNARRRATRDSEDEYESRGRRPRDFQNFDSVVLESRGDAERLRDSLLAALDEYKQFSVGDLFDYAEISTDYPDRGWGWTQNEIIDIPIRRLRSDRYILELPPAVRIED